jgi:hypothetical protein
MPSCSERVFFAQRRSIGVAGAIFESIRDSFWIKCPWGGLALAAAPRPTYLGFVQLGCQSKA